jgi:hypothetical protein
MASVHLGSILKPFLMDVLYNFCAFGLLMAFILLMKYVWRGFGSKMHLLGRKTSKT